MVKRFEKGHYAIITHMAMDAPQLARAGALRAAHLAPELLVLPNVWDAASARTVAALPGCRALATASWAIAAARGLPDGEAIEREAMIATVGIVAAAVGLPVSADLEAGYGDPAETVALAVAAGAVGANLEDNDGAGGLAEAVRHADAIGAVRGREPDVVINARTDVFFGTGVDDLEEALKRGRAYLAAGADCIFVPGLNDPAAIASLVKDMGGPVSLLVTPDSPPLQELQAMGVARATVGPGLMGVAMAALSDAAAALLALGPTPGGLGFRPPGA